MQFIFSFEAAEFWGLFSRSVHVSLFYIFSISRAKVWKGISLNSRFELNAKTLKKQLRVSHVSAHMPFEAHVHVAATPFLPLLSDPRPQLLCRCPCFYCRRSSAPACLDWLEGKRGHCLDRIWVQINALDGIWWYERWAVCADVDCAWLDRGHRLSDRKILALVKISILYRHGCQSERENVYFLLVGFWFVTSTCTKLSSIFSRLVLHYIPGLYTHMCTLLLFNCTARAFV